MTIKLVNKHDNTVWIVESKSADIPLLFSTSGPAYLINDNFYDADEWYWEEVRFDKIKLRDDKNADCNSSDFQKDSDGLYDYSL